MAVADERSTTAASALRWAGFPARPARRSASERTSVRSFRPAYFAWTIWAFCIGAAVLYNHLLGRQLPYSDDLSITPFVTGSQHFTPAWLWNQHNEHRIPLPKLLLYLTYKASDANPRIAVDLNIGLMAIVSALAITLMYRMRGRVVVSDAFFPFLLLSLGQLSLQWGFDLAFISTTFLVGAASILLLGSEKFPGVTDSGLLAISLLCIPLTGGAGLLYAPFICAWLFMRAVHHLRTPAVSVNWHDGEGRADATAGERTGAKLLIAATCGCIVICLLYLVGYRSAPHDWPAPTPKQFAGYFLRFASASLGVFADRFWPASGVAVFGLLAISVLRLGAIASSRRQPTPQRWRAADIMASMAAFVPIAAGVAYGRGGLPWQGSAHYDTLAVPLLFWCYTSFAVEGPQRAFRAVQPTLAILVGLIWISSALGAIGPGEQRTLKAEQIFRDLHCGATPEAMQTKYMSEFFFVDIPESRALVRDRIADLRRSGLRAYALRGGGACGVRAQGTSRR